MKDLIVYKCLECGNYVATKYDGCRCSCGGKIKPLGYLKMLDKDKKINNITVPISIKDTDKFIESLELIKEIHDRKDVPEDIRIKIRDYIRKL